MKRKLLLKVIKGVVWIEFLSLMVSGYTEDIKEEKGIPPERGVVLYVNRKWASRHWAGDMRAKSISLYMEKDFPRFTVGETGLRSVWTYYLDLPVDFKLYPIAVLKYRAKNIHITSDNYVIWLDDGTGPDYGGLVVFKSKELMPDGSIHELRKDLREFNPKGAIRGIALGVMCGDKTPAVFDLVGISFEAPADAKPKEDLKEDTFLNVLVVDSEGRPLNGAKVIIDAERKNFARSAMTDNSGICKIKPLVNDASKHMLRIEMEDMVSIEHSDLKQIDDKPIQITMRRGIHYGGIIQDEKGNPIEGVTVSFHIAREGKEGTRMQSQFDILTDIGGRWRSPLLPDELSDIWIKLYHPDYASDPIFGMTQKPPMEKLRDGTGVMVLKRGFSMTGIVTDEQGQLIPGAIVKQGQDRHGSHYPTTQTDKDGYFRFDNSPLGEMVITVQKDGYAPEIKVVQVTKNIGQLEFVLHPGKTIRGQVVTTDGKPLPDIMIEADTWRGYRTIDWGSKTDAEGRFQWNSAPSEEVTFDLISREYTSVRRYPMKPSDEKYVIVVKKPTIVKLHVVDDITSKPVTEFEVMEGIKWGDDRPIYWSKQDIKVHKNPEGYYEYGFTEPREGHALRVIADGYSPGDTPIIKDGEQTETFEIRLKKGGNFQGIVISQDGRILSGAEVGWFQGNQYAMVNDTKLEQRSEITCTKTDPTGRFILPPQGETGLLVILHEEGWKKIMVDKPGDVGNISVEPWSVVQGKAWIGIKPVVNQQIKFFVQDTYSDNMPGVHWNTSTLTGEDGSFVLSHVPDGDIHVGVYVRKGNSGFISNRVYVKAKPGEAHEIQIGGTGRAVIGSVISRDDFKDKSFSDMFIQGSLRTRRPRLEPPVEIAGDKKRVNEWRMAFIKSPEGQAWVEEERKAVYFTVYIEPDGSFRVDDVPPSTYELRIYANEKIEGRMGAQGKQIAQGTGEVTVPPGAMPTDGSIDVGNIVLIKNP